MTPRSVWVALGCVATALAAVAVGTHAAAACSIGWGVGIIVVASAGLRSARARRSPNENRFAGVGAPAVLRVSASVGAGALALGVRLLLSGPAPAPALPADAGPWTGGIESVSSPRSGEQVAIIELRPISARLYATLPRYPPVAPGDRVEVDGSVRPPPDDGFGDYLRSAGLAGTLRARELRLLSSPADAGRLLEASRRASGEALSRVLPEPEAGLAAGILVGLRDRVDRQLAADFTTAGVSHVVAISGWNIAIVGGVVAALARGLPRRRRAILTVLAIAAYTAFAGASPSVLRAAVMAAVVLSARESGRSGTAAAALGWAICLILLVEPAMVSDAGFQLSSLATGGLLVWASPLDAALRRSRAIRRLPGFVIETLAVSFAAQAATLPVVLVTFGRLAVVAPAVNLLVVPLVAPVMAVAAIALAAGWLTFAGLPGTLATLAALPAWAALTLLVTIVRASARVPYASLSLTPPSSWLAALLAALAVIATGTHRGRSIAASVFAWGRKSTTTDGRPAERRASPRAVAGAGAPGGGAAAKTPGRGQASAGNGPVGTGSAGASVNLRHGRLPVRLVVAVVACAIVALALVAAARPDGRVTITILDVGQGDAILVEGDRGSRMLVDGGPDPDRLLMDLDARLPPWDRRLDLVVVTHPHEDHVAGLAGLFDRYRIGRVIESEMAGAGPGFEAWEAGLRAHDIAVGPAHTGDRLELDGLRLDVLWPDEGTVPRAPPDTGSGVNNVSIVLLGTFGSERILLTGDAEEDVDPVLVSRGLPRVDLLKVAHHGSRTATSQALLDAISPKIAAISVGEGNTYGHPAESTLRRLANAAGTVFRTDRAGSVTIALDGRTMTASADHGSGAAVGAGPVGETQDYEHGSRPPLRASAERASGLRASGLRYHREDVGTRTSRVIRAAPLPASPDLVPPSLARGRGGRSLARRTSRRTWDRGRSTGCRGSGAAARHRQAPRRVRPRSPPAPRRRVCRVAREDGHVRAGPDRRGPSCHALRE